MEGETDDESVNTLRQRQMRNMHMALMLSQGTPMVLMGDPLTFPPSISGLLQHANCAVPQLKLAASQ